MNITIKNLSGPETVLTVPEDSLVSDIKDIVENKWNIKKFQQRLVFKGKPLEDCSRLDKYGVEDGAKLYLSVKKENASIDTNQQSSNPSQSEQPQGSQSIISAATQMLQSLLPVQREPEVPRLNFWHELYTLLKEHYTENDAQKILEHYKMHFKESVSSLSLDDIERLATLGIHREKNCNHSTKR